MWVVVIIVENGVNQSLDDVHIRVHLCLPKLSDRDNNQTQEREN